MVAIAEIKQITQEQTSFLKDISKPIVEKDKKAFLLAVKIFEAAPHYYGLGAPSLDAMAYHYWKANCKELSKEGYAEYDWFYDQLYIKLAKDHQ